ncbi:MAG: potassium/proton antiporter [Bacteroidales bacterium]|jgi:cell volume regulation protein A|nr:potassium/proton antiporter [Bacteroidales bacterium]
MFITLENILLVGSLLLILSVFFSKSSKYGIPTVVLFILVGMLAGADGLGKIDFFDIHLSKFIGTLALILILFSGGLDTRYSDIRPVLIQGALLSTLGVVITAVVTGLFISYITKMNILEGLLLGSIISSTDAASVFTILRAKNTGLKGKIRPLLELESGSNDPMAYFLTIFFIFIIQTESLSAGKLIVMFCKQFLLGIPFGILMGFLIIRTINRIHLSFDGLYSVLLIAFAVFTFAFSEFIGGNGYLSVYIAACMLGNKDFVHKRSLTKHFDGQAWLMQIIMFLTLGLLVYPKQLVPVAPLGLVLAIFTILVARPLAVFISLAFSGFNFRSKVFISWVGLRGAVPIILSIYVLDAQIENGMFIFNLVFFISLLSVLIQGSTISWMAGVLGLSVPVNIRKKSAMEEEFTTTVKPVRAEMEVLPGSPMVNKTLVSMSIPKDILISMVTREDVLFVPDGTTVFHPGDKLTVMTDTNESLDRFMEMLK